MHSVHDVLMNSTARGEIDTPLENQGDSASEIAVDTPELRSDEYWLFHLFPLHLTLPVLVTAATSAFVARIFTAVWWFPVLVAVIIVIVTLTPVRRVSLAHYLNRAISFRGRLFGKRSAAVQHSPFDVPLPDGGSYGMRWDGDRLITMLRIDAQPRTVTRLSPSGLLGEDVLPLAELARCLDQFDIRLAAIDVIGTGSRSAGTGPVARAYESILGPLPAVAHRTVWVVLRLDPLANAAAVDRRGGGGEGTLRAATVATRRVANRLAARGLSAIALSATEMSEAVAQLTLGAAPAEFHESADSLSHNGFHHVSYRMTPEALGPRGIAGVWSTPTVASTITVRLQRVPDSVRDTGSIAVTALARFTTRDTPCRVRPSGLVPLPGNQRRAMLFSLPLGSGVPALPLDSYLGPPDALDRVPLPIAGCGQLVGADSSGQGVALPLVSRQVRRVEVIGSALVAKQVVLRAVALGASVVVHTNRHDEWRPMVGRVGMPQALSLATWSAGSQQASSYRFATMVVFDGIAPSGQHSDATVLLLHRHGQMADGFAPDVTLLEDPATANLVTVRTESGETRVRMVATPDELRYVGAPPPAVPA